MLSDKLASYYKPQAIHIIYSIQMHQFTINATEISHICKTAQYVRHTHFPNAQYSTKNLDCGTHLSMSLSSNHMLYSSWKQ